MPYLLDSNVFIEAKNKYYRFSLCPGFWDWLIGAVLTNLARCEPSGVFCQHSVYQFSDGAGSADSFEIRKVKRSGVTNCFAVRFQESLDFGSFG